jgi:mannitol/fructose-specific phosphotransferase system IIA component (Ntr-type)
MAVSTHSDGLEYPALDGQPVRLVFCLLGDTNTAADHLAGLARLARLARRSAALQPLLEATNGDAFVAALRRLEGN